MELTIRDLRYFAAVAEESHLTRAAKRLHVSPATLSAAIKRLERSTGVELFERRGRGITLSTAGAELARRAHSTLRAVDNFEAAVENQRSGVGATLTIGTVSGFAGRWVARANTNLKTGVLRYVASGYDNPTAGLVGGAVNAAIVWGPSDHDEVLDERPLGFDPRMAAVPAGHELADRPSVSLAELDELGWLDLPPTDERWHRYWRGDVERGGPPPVIAGTCATDHERFAAVMAGDGACAVHRSIAKLMVLDGVAIVPIDDLPPCPVRFVFRSGDRRADRLEIAYEQLLPLAEPDLLANDGANS